MHQSRELYVLALIILSITYKTGSTHEMHTYYYPNIALVENISTFLSYACRRMNTKNVNSPTFISVVKCWHTLAVSINTLFGFVGVFSKCQQMKCGTFPSPILDTDFRCKCVYICHCVGDGEVEITLDYNS